MTWQTEFPDWGDMPDLPEGWEDTSWHNDAMPTYHKAPFIIWLDHPEFGMREVPEFSKHRFMLEWRYEDRSEVIAESDEWPIILAAANKAVANLVDD